MIALACVDGGLLCGPLALALVSALLALWARIRGRPPHPPHKGRCHPAGQSPAPSRDRPTTDAPGAHRGRP